MVVVVVVVRQRGGDVTRSGGQHVQVSRKELVEGQDKMGSSLT